MLAKGTCSPIKLGDVSHFTNGNVRISGVCWDVSRCPAVVTEGPISRNTELNLVKSFCPKRAAIGKLPRTGDSFNMRIPYSERPSASSHGYPYLNFRSAEVHR